MIGGGFIQVFSHEMTGKQRLIFLLLIAFITGVIWFSFFKEHEENIEERNEALIEVLTQ